jgi:hypothetical protein
VWVGLWAEDFGTTLSNLLGINPSEVDKMLLYGNIDALCATKKAQIFPYGNAKSSASTPRTRKLCGRFL